MLKKSYYIWTFLTPRYHNGRFYKLEKKINHNEAEIYLSREEPVDDLTTPEDMVSPGNVFTKPKQYSLHHKQNVYIKMRLYFYCRNFNQLNQGKSKQK